MNGFSTRNGWGLFISATAVFALSASFGLAQVANPFAPPTSAIDTLSGGSTGSASGNFNPVNRAREAAKTTTPGAKAINIPTPNVGGPPPAPGQAQPKRPGAPLNEAANAAARVVRPRIKAIVGTRALDAVTGELLDDAQVMMIDEAEKSEYFDDGSHGDRIKEDGEYARVETTRDHIGQSNQRLKERLIQAIYSAEQLDPLEFFGYHLMTTERTTPAPRNRRWTLAPDPKGGLGLTVMEIAAEKPLEVPKYYKGEQDKDQKIAGKDGWAVRFLDEYRLNRGDLASQFYPVYIPKPPVPPFGPPPANWNPFPNPEGPKAQQPGPAGMGPYGYKLQNPLPSDYPQTASNMGYFNGAPKGAAGKAAAKALGGRGGSLR